MPTNFGSRLQNAFDEHGQLCVGIDPHAALLEEWGLPDSAEGVREFSKAVVDAAAETVGVIKPQVSFYERFGSKGFAVLEEIAQEAQAAKLLVIMDAKRGDIGTTMTAYYEAWLGKDAPFVCDALTVSPYLGFDSLAETMSNTAERGKGLFVLAATSNPEGASVQKAQIGDTTLAADIWSRLERVNAITAASATGLGSFGAVVGATLNLTGVGLGSILNERAAVATPILAPGFGAQGAELGDIKRLFGASAETVLASVSRSVLSAGAKALQKAISSAKAELAAGLK